MVSFLNFHHCFSKGFKNAPKSLLNAVNAFGPFYSIEIIPYNFWYTKGDSPNKYVSRYIIILCARRPKAFLKPIFDIGSFFGRNFGGCFSVIYGMIISLWEEIARGIFAFRNFFIKKIKSHIPIEVQGFLKLILLQAV